MSTDCKLVFAFVATVAFWLLMLWLTIWPTLGHTENLDCPMFGTSDPQHNVRCLVQEYQGYANALSPRNISPVVFCAGEFLTAKAAMGAQATRHGDSCVLLLKAPFSFDELWSGQRLCAQELGR